MQGVPRLVDGLQLHLLGLVLSEPSAAGLEPVIHLLQVLVRNLQTRRLRLQGETRWRGS